MDQDDHSGPLPQVLSESDRDLICPPRVQNSNPFHYFLLSLHSVICLADLDGSARCYRKKFRQTSDQSCFTRSSVTINRPNELVFRPGRLYVFKVYTSRSSIVQRASVYLLEDAEGCRTDYPTYPHDQLTNFERVLSSFRA